MKDLIITLCCLYFLINAPILYAQNNFKFQHILITNDDGVEDADRLLALAKSVKKVALRVSVVVSSFDRSGTSNHTTFGKHQSTLEITCKYHDKKNNIRVYVMPGNPADCVLLGLNGLFPNDKPDLVLSGINGGPNIGPGWFGSGTIGAIRTSAFLGVRGIALSGFEDDDERSFSIIPNWITKFISSDLINEMGENSYLTIGFPKIPLDQIKGVQIAPRKISFDKPNAIVFHKIYGEKEHEPENTSVWTIKYLEELHNKSTNYDKDFLAEGYIVITPMSINENNTQLLNVFQNKLKEVPAFTVE
jgi:5'-nucleotidase